MVTEEHKFKGEEKRRYPRVQSAVIEIKYNQQEEFQEPAFIKDLSLGGACVYVIDKLDMGRIVFLKIHLLGGSSPIETVGNVVWCRKSSYLNYFEIGIELTELGDTDRDRLNEYISKFVEIEPDIPE